MAEAVLIPVVCTSVVGKIDLIVVVDVDQVGILGMVVVVVVVIVVVGLEKRKTRKDVMMFPELGNRLDLLGQLVNDTAFIPAA